MIDKLFPDAYRMAHDLGVLVEILTNGSRLAAPKHLAPLTRRRPNRITLSLYGATAKSYDGLTRRKGAYRMFLQGLTAAHEADLPLGLALIITRHNAHEADQMRASADRYGLPSREYTHMSPTIYGGAAPSPPRHPTISPTASRCGAATPATRSSMSIRGGMAPICKVGRDNAIPLITEGVEGDLPDFLWVLADGFGPMKAALDEEREARHDAALADLAERHATTPRRPAREIIAEAHEQRFEPTLTSTTATGRGIGTLQGIWWPKKPRLGHHRLVRP